jgi:hypothetical protein
MSRRNWIKIYPEGFLRRTLYQELMPIERWVWVGFLCLAGDNALDGKICIADDMGYTDEQLAKLLDIDTKILKISKDKMIKFEKISVDKNNVIQILSWNTYQSEYQRQRDYQAERRKKLTTQTYNATLRVDRDIDKDIDKIKIKKDKDKYLDFVYLSKEEYKKLEDKLGKSKTDDYIEKLNTYIGSKGKNYKSHYFTILNWVKMEQDKKPKYKELPTVEPEEEFIRGKIPQENKDQIKRLKLESKLTKTGDDINEI